MCPPPPLCAALLSSVKVITLAYAPHMRWFVMVAFWHPLVFRMMVEADVVKDVDADVASSIFFE